MKNLELEPQQLAVTNHVQEEIVAIYLSLLARDFREAVGRVIASPIRPIYHKGVDLYISEPLSDASHLIIEGNHRAVAYALIDGKVPIIEITNQSDFARCKSMARQGEIPHFVHKGTYPDTIRNGIKQFFNDSRRLDKFIAKELKDRGIELKKLPPYIQRAVKFPEQ